MDKKLKWGETPWGGWEGGKLLIELCKAYSTITSLRCALSQFKEPDSENPYWGSTGVGGSALAKADVCLESLRNGFDSEDIYRQFFRTAESLMFPGLLNVKWVICERCGLMAGDIDRAIVAGWLGKPCCEVVRLDKSCTGRIREFRWSDLHYSRPPRER